MRLLKFIVNLAILLLVNLYLSGCNQNQKSEVVASNNDTTAIFFPFFLSEKTMIVNEEQNNELEGHYLKVLEIINDSTFQFNMPEDFYLHERNYSQWMLGWHTDKPYYDAANENLREIVSINFEKHQVVLGKILRGEAYPKKNQRIVFWNRSPSGFKNSNFGRIANPKWWKSFAGESIEFGSILFDSTRLQWIMYLQEVDTNRVKIYAATSTDFKKWIPYKNGEAFFKPEDFKNTEWAGKSEDGSTPQTARMYSVIFERGTYFFFLSGYDKSGKRHIGLITASDPLIGPFIIYPKPIISPGKEGCDMNGCFYPKVCRANNHFIIYYDGVAADRTERLCLAESENLFEWKKYSGNPVIDKHYGWRSGTLTTEPNYVEYRNDTVWVMSAGYKKYNTEFTNLDSIRNEMPQDKSIFSSTEIEKGKHISGNVMDAEIGVFLSTDGGHTFRPHSNNPIWINDYSDTLQNDHIGGDFFYLGNSILYQAKSEAERRYNILLREK